MNCLVYPTRVMKVTQNYRQGNHLNHYKGTPRDYPMDEAGADAGRDWFYCPCDKMRIKKLYGVGGKGVNTLWLESVGEVDMPCGKAVVTIMVEHVEDEDLKKLAVGQEFVRGQKMFREGKDGAVGNHFHLSVGTGRIKGSGWEQNDLGAWVLSVEGKTLPPEFAFYLGATTVRDSAGLSFPLLPKEEITLDNIPDGYAEKAVKWAKENGILRGDDKGDLKLHEPITRQDAVVMMYRMK